MGTTLENFETQTKSESITFDLIAMIRQIVTGAVDSNGTSTTAGGSGGAGGIRPGGGGSNNAGGDTQNNEF